MEVCGSSSPRFFSVILAQLAGLPRFPAPSTVSLGSPVLNPKPHYTFSWPTSKSPFTLFLPASLLNSSKLLREGSASLLHLAFQLPKLHGRGRPKAMWFFLSWLLHLGLDPAPIFLCPFLTPPTISYTCQHSSTFPAFLGCHSKSRQARPCGVESIISKLLCRFCNQG